MQLPLFEKKAEECEDNFDRWIYVLKHMETFKRLPWAAQNSVFQRLAEIADISSLSREERQKYDVALRKYRDTLGVLEGAQLRGATSKGIEIARNMKVDGMSTELIQKYTGLSVEEIAEL